MNHSIHLLQTIASDWLLAFRVKTSKNRLIPTIFLAPFFDHFWARKEKIPVREFPSPKMYGKREITGTGIPALRTLVANKLL